MYMYVVLSSANSHKFVVHMHWHVVDENQQEDWWQYMACGTTDVTNNPVAPMLLVQVVTIAAVRTCTVHVYLYAIFTALSSLTVATDFFIINTLY